MAEATSSATRGVNPAHCGGRGSPAASSHAGFGASWFARAEDAAFSHLTSSAFVTEAAVVLVASWYLLGVARRLRQGERWPYFQVASMLAGLGLIWFALCTGISCCGPSDFTAEVVQHVLLMMLAPPLIVLGRPFALVGGGPLGARLAHLAGNLRARSLYGLGLAGAAAYYGFMWLYFFTPLYADSAESPALHGFVHGLLVALGLCYWQFVLAPGRPSSQSTHMRRVGSILLSMPLEMYLGYCLHSLGHSIGAGTTAASVDKGGEVFWWFTMLICGVALGAAIAKWMFDDERATARLGQCPGEWPEALLGLDEELSGWAGSG